MSTDTLKMMNIRAAKGWKPAAGDTLTGTVVHISGATSEYGVYPVVTLAVDTEDPETLNYVAVHAFHTVLKRELTGLRPTEGHKLSITYGGEQDTGKVTDDGRAITMHMYSVTSDNPSNFWATF